MKISNRSMCGSSFKKWKKSPVSSSYPQRPHVCSLPVLPQRHFFAYPSQYTIHSFLHKRIYNTHTRMIYHTHCSEPCSFPHYILKEAVSWPSVKRCSSLSAMRSISLFGCAERVPSLCWRPSRWFPGLCCHEVAVASPTWMPVCPCALSVISRCTVAIHRSCTDLRSPRHCFPTDPWGVFCQTFGFLPVW